MNGYFRGDNGLSKWAWLVVYYADLWRNEQDCADHELFGAVARKYAGLIFNS